MTVYSLLRRPAAFVPMAMSLAALLVVAAALATGTARAADEGAAAHLFQLLLGLQLPLLLLFARRWLRLAPRAAGQVLLLQLACVAAALLPVRLLGL